MLGSVSGLDSSLARTRMPRCPVCQVRFVEGKTECCPVCSWDVQPLTLLTGLIPEVVEKEAVRLKWAKALWNSLQTQREKFHQVHLQLQETAEQTQQIQDQLTQVSQENAALTEILHQHEITIAKLQQQLEQGNQEQTQPVGTEPVTPISAAEDLDIEEPQFQEINPAIPAIKPLETASAIDTLNLDLEQTNQGISPAAAAPSDDAMLKTVQLQNGIIFPAATPLTSAKASPAKTDIAPALPLSHGVVQEFVFDVVTIQQQRLERRKQKAFSFHQSLEAGVKLEMVLVPGGTFWMGSPESEAERDRNEAPQHEVTIAPFCLSKFPITQAQWRAIAALPKIKRSLSLYPSNFEGDDRPVELVSWYDAIEFCARLSQKTGQLYRLPSEAEWEYACRAGTTTPFHFGDTILSDLANYDGNYVYGTGSEGSYHQGTTPVGAFQTANAFGLYDMHGNVWEWCADPWHENYQTAPTDGSIWQNDEGGTYQVLRGGAWYCLPGLCRSAQRHWNQPDVGGSGIGFRVVC